MKTEQLISNAVYFALVVLALTLLVDFSGILRHALVT